jgi:RimJ/RimL family protein N-acetyltransferase
MTTPDPVSVRPADRIVLDGLVLRPWAPDDAEAVLAAVTASFEHLHPWMPWAAEPPTLAAQREHIDAMAHQRETGESYTYGIFDPAETTVLGTIGLHRRVGPGGWDIGYWVHAGHTGRGIATTCAAVLTGVGLSLPGTERVEIHCDQANAASAAVPARLGYRLDRIDERRPVAPAESGKLMIWVMTRDAYPGSEARRLAERLAAEFHRA